MAVKSVYNEITELKWGAAQLGHAFQIFGFGFNLTLNWFLQGVQILQVKYCLLTTDKHHKFSNRIKLDAKYIILYKN